MTPTEEQVNDETPPRLMTSFDDLPANTQVFPVEPSIVWWWGVGTFEYAE